MYACHQSPDLMYACTHCDFVTLTLTSTTTHMVHDKQQVHNKLMGGTTSGQVDNKWTDGQ